MRPNIFGQVLMAAALIAGAGLAHAADKHNSAVPSIHIIVDNGHVTLTGVVMTDMDKQIAGMRASSGLSFGSVVNNLQVENPTPRKS